jgi:hypothetical protein
MEDEQIFDPNKYLSSQKKTEPKFNPDDYLKGNGKKQAEGSSTGLQNTSQNGKSTSSNGGGINPTFLPSTNTPTYTDTPSALTDKGKGEYVQDQIVKKEKATQLSNDLNKYKAVYEQAQGTPLANTVNQIPLPSGEIKNVDNPKYTDKQNPSIIDKSKQFISDTLDGSEYILSGTAKGIENMGQGLNHMGAARVLGLNEQVMSAGMENTDESLQPSKQVQARFNDTKVVSQLRGLAEFIPAALGASSTSGATFFLNGVGSATKEVEDLKRQGVKFPNGSDEFYIYGKGIIDYLLMDRLNSHTIFDKFPKTFRDNIVKKLSIDAIAAVAKQGEKVSAESAMEMFKEKTLSFADNLKVQGINFLKSYAATSVDLTGLSTSNFALGKATNKLSGQDIFKQTPEQLGESIKKIFTIDAPVFAGFGLSKSIVGQLGRQSPYTNELFKEIQKDNSPENINRIKQELTTHLQERGLSEQEIKDSNDRLDVISEASKAVPNTLKGEKFQKAVEIVMGKKELQTQLDEIKASKQPLDESLKDIPTKEESLVEAKLEQSSDKLRELATSEKYKYNFNEEKGTYTKQLGKGKEEEISKDRYELEQLETQFKNKQNESTNEKVRDEQENGQGLQNEGIKSEREKNGQDANGKDVQKEVLKTEGVDNTTPLSKLDSTRLNELYKKKFNKQDFTIEEQKEFFDLANRKNEQNRKAELAEPINSPFRVENISTSKTVKGLSYSGEKYTVSINENGDLFIGIRNEKTGGFDTIHEGNYGNQESALKEFEKYKKPIIDEINAKYDAKSQSNEKGNNEEPMLEGVQGNRVENKGEQGSSTDENLLTKPSEIKAEKTIEVDRKPLIENKEPKKVSDDFQKLANRSLETSDIGETSSNVESVTGDMLDLGDKQFHKSTFENSIPMGIEVINAAKIEFGDSYVSDTLNYLDANKNTMSLEKRVLITLSLENELRRQALAEPDNLTVKKQIKLVTVAGMELLRDGAKANALGRIRHMIEVGYDDTRITSELFTSKQKKARNDLIDAIESTPEDIQKESELQEQAKEDGKVTEDIPFVKPKGEKLTKIREERKAIKNELSAFLKKNKNVINSFGGALGATVEFTGIVAKLIKNYAKEGIVTSVDVAKQLAEDYGKKFVKDNQKVIDDAYEQANTKRVQSPEQKRKTYITKLKNDITSLDEQIDLGERKIVSKEDKYAHDKEINDLRDIRDTKKDKLDEVDPTYKEQVKLKQGLDAAEKSLKEYERKINENDFNPSEDKSTKEVVKQLQDLRDARDKVKQEYNENKKAYEESLVTPEEKAQAEVDKEISKAENAISALQDKLAGKTATPKETSIWTKEIGDLKKKQAELKKELSDKRGAEKEPSIPKTPEEINASKVETAKKNIQKRIDLLNKEIEDKKHTQKKSNTLKPDSELQDLISERNELTKVRDKEIPLDKKPITDEARLKSQVTRLTGELDKLDKQIKEGKKSPKEGEKPKLTNEQIQKLEVEKKAKTNLLNDLDPDFQNVVKKGLIEAGFGKETTVTVNEKDANGNDVLDEKGNKVKVKEKRQVIDWVKLAGREGSVENIAQHVADYLKGKGYSDAEISRMKESFKDNYTQFRTDIIEKSNTSLNNQNQKIKESVGKSNAKRLAELYDLGLYEKNRAEYDNLINKSIGLSDVSQKSFEQAKELSKSYSTLLSTKDAKGNQMSEVALRKLINNLQTRQEELLTHTVNAEVLEGVYKNVDLKTKEGVEDFAGKLAFIMTKTIKEYSSLGQRAILGALTQVAENPISGYVERGIQNFGDFVTRNKISTPEQRKQWRKAAKNQLMDIVLHGGDDFGHKTSIFITKSEALDWLNGRSDSEIWHIGMAVFGQKAYLEAADSMHKINMTEKFFSDGAIRVMMKKGIPKDVALQQISEAMTGKSFKDALIVARQVIDKVNSESGKKVLPDNKNAVYLSAMDIVKQNLISNGMLTEKEIKAVANASFKAAGTGMGHVTNNPLSKAISSLNSDITDKLHKAIKEKNYLAGSYYHITSAAMNLAQPFVGGGTNWVVLTLEKSGVASPYFVGRYLIEKYSKHSELDLSGTQSQITERLYKIQAKRAEAVRSLTGLAFSSAVVMTYLLAQSDDNKNKSLIQRYSDLKKQYPVFKRVSNKVDPAILMSLMAYSSGDKKDVSDFYSNVFNIKEVDYFNDSKKGITVLKAAGSSDQTKINAAWGALGQLTLGKISSPIPSWKIATDFYNIGVDFGYNTPLVKDYQASGYWNGVFQGGLVETLGIRPQPKVAMYDVNTGKERNLEGKQLMEYNAMVALIAQQNIEENKEDLSKMNPDKRKSEINGYTTKAGKESLNIMSGVNEGMKEIGDDGKTYKLTTKQIKIRAGLKDDFDIRHIDFIDNEVQSHGLDYIEARKLYNRKLNEFTKDKMLKMNKNGEITLIEK